MTEAIKLLTGIGEPLLGRLMVYDALEMTYRKIRVRKDPNCAICGENPTVTELIDYDDFCGAVSDEAQAAAVGSTITATELKDWQDVGQADRPRRRARAGRVGDRADPRVAAHPEGRDPHRQGPGRPAAGPPDRAVLQDAASARPRRWRRSRPPASSDAVHVQGGVVSWVKTVDPSLPVY